MLAISPILSRELLTFLRTRRAVFGLLLAYLAILSAATGICWWTGVQNFGWLNRDLLSRTLFITVTIAQLLIFSAYAIIMTGTKINSERDEKTLDLLLTAPLSSFHIIMAKYFSALAVILLLVLASVPFLSLCFLLGGVSRREVLIAYYLILLAVLTYGMVGIACSTVCRKNYVALGSGFFIAILGYGGLALLLMMTVEFLDISDVLRELFGMHGWEISLLLFVASSPLVCYITSIIEPVPPANIPMLWGVVPMQYVPLAFHAIFQFIVFAMSFLIAWRGFKRLTGERERPPKVKKPKRAKAKAVAPGEAPVEEPAAESPPPRKPRQYRPIRDGANPVYARENRMFYSRRFPARVARLLIGGVILIGTIVVYWEGSSSGGGYQFYGEMVGLAIWTSVLIAFFTPMLGARAVTSERETHCLDLLATTTLRPFEVIWGKFMAVIRRVFGATVIFTLLVLFVFPRPDGGVIALLGDWIKIAVPLFAIVWFYAALGLLCSALCRRTAAAVVMAYGIIVGMGLLLIFNAFYTGLTGGDFSEGALSVITPIMAPAFYFVQEDGVNMFHENERWSMILTYSAVMLGLAWIMLAQAAARFAALTGSRFQIGSPAILDAEPFAHSLSKPEEERGTTCQVVKASSSQE